MTHRFRPEIENVPESPLITIAAEAEALPGAIKLCYGESDLPTPEFIIRAADEAARAGHTTYTHTAGSPALRDAIAAKVFELHGVQLRRPEVVCTIGASMALYLAIRAFVGDGDNAVIVTPAYPLFKNAVAMAGGECRFAQLITSGPRFALDLDAVRHAIDARTRMIIVNSPSNPTGWVISREEQRAVVELARAHNLIVLADEVYERLTYGMELASSFASAADGYDGVIVANSFSKSFNMTGWRLGWAQASEKTAHVMYAAAEFMTSNPNSMAMQAGIVALREGDAYVRELRGHYAARRAQVQAALSGIPGLTLPAIDGAFFAYPRIEGLEDSAARAAELLHEAKVALAPGSAFNPGGEGHLRLCFAASEATMTEALARLRSALSA